MAGCRKRSNCRYNYREDGTGKEIERVARLLARAAAPLAAIIGDFTCTSTGTGACPDRTFQLFLCDIRYRVSLPFWLEGICRKCGQGPSRSDPAHEGKQGEAGDI